MANNHVTTIHEDILSRQLDLEKLLSLPKEKADLIIKLFDDLMNSFFQGGMPLPGGVQMDVTRMVVIYNTLVDGGWLVTPRERTLNKLTE